MTTRPKPLRPGVDTTSDAITEVRDLARTHEGTVSNMQVASGDEWLYHYDERGTLIGDGAARRGWITVRVPTDSYEDFIGQSEKELKQAYGVISPRKVNLSIDGAAVTAVRCDIQAYYAVLATITYDSGDVVYVSALTKLASISDVVNLVESVSLS